MSNYEGCAQCHLAFWLPAPLVVIILEKKKNMQRGWAIKVTTVTNDSGEQRGPVRKSWDFDIRNGS